MRFSILPLSVCALHLLAACESEETVATDMERALAESSTALVGALFATEVLVHVYDEADPDTGTTLRHGGPACGCPCIERVGEGSPYILTLDYDVFGCVPESRLLPTGLTGHAVVEFDEAQAEVTEVTWDGMQFALELGVSGDLSGSVSSDASTLGPRGELTIGPETMRIAVDVQVDEAGITLDGEVEVAREEPRVVLFESVGLPFERLGLPCVTPTQGKATQTHKREKRSAVVRFEEPGGGFVTVERKGRVSQPTDWCGYRSDLW